MNNVTALVDTATTRTPKSVLIVTGPERSAVPVAAVAARANEATVRVIGRYYFAPSVQAVHEREAHLTARHHSTNVANRGSSPTVREGVIGALKNKGDPYHV